MRAGQVDVLLAPMAAAKASGKAGAPVVAIPVGLDGDSQPFGVTVLAAPGADHAFLRAAAAIEALAGRRVCF